VLLSGSGITAAHDGIRELGRPISLRAFAQERVRGARLKHTSNTPTRFREIAPGRFLIQDRGGALA
jgi:hypothetical protein